MYHSPKKARYCQNATIVNFKVHKKGLNHIFKLAKGPLLCSRVKNKSVFFFNEHHND